MSALDQHACDLIQESGYARLEHYFMRFHTSNTWYHTYVCTYVGHYVFACHKYVYRILFTPSLLNDEKSNYIDNPRTHATTDIVLGNNTRVGTANEC